MHIQTELNMGIFFFKQKTAYEIVSRDWSSDVCSSDLVGWSNDGLLNFHQILHEVTRVAQ